MKRKNLPDIDSEFLLVPWNGSVRLEKPEAIQNKNCMSISSFFALPFNIYFYDLQNLFITMNEENSLRNGNISARDMLGKPLTKFFTDETIYAASAYHQQVLNSQQLCIKEELWTTYNTQLFLATISFKFPWYDSQGTLSGIFGCSIMPEVHNLPTALATLTQLGLLAKSHRPRITGKQLKDYYLSQRELECLKLLARGNTAKMTGQYLKISPRTVESYIENIKCKLNAYSKAELCTKAMELGLIYETY